MQAGILIGFYTEQRGTREQRRRVEIEPRLEERDGRLRLAITHTAGDARKDGRFIMDSHGDPRAFSGGAGAAGEVSLVTDFAAGWDAARRDRLAEIAKRWHLNDMNAFCEHQREKAAALRRAPHELFATPFEWKNGARAEGKKRAPRCPVCGYEYGTAWLYEELPADVVAFMREVIGTNAT